MITLKKNEVGVSFDIVEDLSMTSISVLIKMAEEMSADSVVSVTVKDLAIKTGYSERSIKRALKELKLNGAIEKNETIYNVSNKYIKRGVK